MAEHSLSPSSRDSASRSRSESRSRVSSPDSRPGLSRSRSDSRRHHRRSRRSRARRSPTVDSGSGGRHPEAEPGPVSAKVQLCTIHGNNLVPDICNVCRHCTHFIKAPVVKQLVVASAPTVPGVIPGPADRLLVRRSDERDPTLVFTQEEMVTI